jgi:hypothetical protein
MIKLISKEKKLFPFCKLANREMKKLNWFQKPYILFAGKARADLKTERTRLVREYFKAARNTASGQKMGVLKPVLDEALIQHSIHHLNKPGNIGAVHIISGRAVLFGSFQ